MKETVLAIFLALLVSGCGGGKPSKSDFKQAIKKELEKEIKMQVHMAKMMGGGSDVSEEDRAFEISKLQVDNLREIIEGTYKADVRFVIHAALGADEINAEVVMREIDGYWEISQMK